MRCPVCLVKDTKVNDSRIIDDGFIVKRRRQCLKCGFRFSTHEQSEILNIMVIKRDGRKELYQRDKIVDGLKKSLQKRAYTDNDFQRLVNNVERDIQKRKKDEVTSQELGEIVMRQLKKFDKVAYIRFASVYRSFEDVETFYNELKDLLVAPNNLAKKNKNNRKK
jgi:transcriptional repressor NrdR